MSGCHFSTNRWLESCAILLYIQRVEIWQLESLELLHWKSQHRGPCDLLSSLIPSSTQSSSVPEAFQVLCYTSSCLLRGLLCQICLECGIP